MSALNNLKKKGTILTLGDSKWWEAILAFATKPEKAKASHWNAKKEAIVLWSIILFKHSMPYPSVKCISPALNIICVIKND